ncbi:GNAT family N-acetyltransferase [Aliikangiella maris]|uniref:GNAT family N-acetyltransferase n=2 Tax=Aliikangiella maris TaxID=3162458 RepID=A0ABV3MMS3_9GAMM
MIKIQQASDLSIPLIAPLARTIWEEHYTPIIGKAQVDYMLNQFQSVQAIVQQITQGMMYYLVYQNDVLCGYFAIKIEQKDLFISKFYLSATTRGQGISRIMLAFIEQQANASACEQLSLTVNKDNSARKAYEKLGFSVQKSIKADIGEGYYMDDYVMVKPVSSSI